MLTVKEWIILIILFAFLVSIVVSILKGSFKIALAGLLVLLLFSGFTFVPESVSRWLDSTPEYQPNIEEVMETMGEEAKGWWDSFKELLEKLAGK